MSENFNIRVSDEVDPGILSKLEAIAVKAISAHNAVEKLQAQLSNVGDRFRIDGITSAESKIAGALNNATNLVNDQTRAVDKLARAHDNLGDKASSINRLTSALKQVNLNKQLTNVNGQIDDAKALEKSIRRQKEKQQQIAAQAQFNDVLNVNKPNNNSAKASAEVFKQHFRQQKEALAAEREIAEERKTLRANEEAQVKKKADKDRDEANKAAADLARMQADTNAAAAQAQINKQLGVNKPLENSARASAQAFKENIQLREKAVDRLGGVLKKVQKAKEQEEKIIASEKSKQRASAAQADFNKVLGVNQDIAKAARSSADVFKEQGKAALSLADSINKLKKQKEDALKVERETADKSRATINAADAQARFNQLLGVNRPVEKSAKSSASVFAEADAEKINAQKRAEKDAAQATRERKEAIKEADAALRESNRTNKQAEKAAADLTRRTDALLNSIEPLRGSYQSHNKRVAEASTLLQKGAITQDEYSRAVARSEKILDRDTAALTRNTRARGFTQNQLLTFQYTFNDVVASLASGGSASTIFFQQIGQVTQAFNDPEGAMKGFINRLGLVRLGLIGVGIAAAGAGGLMLAGQSEAARFRNILQLTGNSAGFTADSFEAMAVRVAAANNVTISSSKALANDLLQSGNIQAEQIEQIVFITQRMAKATKQSTDEIIQNWINAADSPSNYAEKLLKLNLLHPTLVQHIKDVEDSGDKTRAFHILAREMYNFMGTKAPESINVVSQAFNWLKVQISDASRTLRSFLLGLTGNISDVKEIAELEERLGEARQKAAKVPAAAPDFFKKIYNDPVKKLEDEIIKRKAAVAETERQAEASSKLAEGNRRMLDFGRKADSFIGMAKGADVLNDKVKELNDTMREMRAIDPKNPKLLDLEKNYDSIVKALSKKNNPPGPKPPKWQQPIEEKRAAFLAQQTSEINKQVAVYGQLREEREVHQKLTEIDIALAAKAAQVQPKDRHKFGKLSEEERQLIRLDIVRQQGNDRINQHVDAIYDEAKAYARNYEAASTAIEILSKKNAATGKSILSDREAGIAMRKRDYEYEQATDSLADFNRELEDNSLLMKMSADQRYIEAPIIQRKRSLEPQGKQLSKEEEEAMRRGLTAMQERERITRSLDAIEAATVGTKQELIAQQNAIAEAQLRGYYTTETYKNAINGLNASFINFNLSQGIGTFEQSVLSSLSRMVEGFTNAKQGITDSFGELFVSIQDGFAQSIGDAIFKGESLRESLQQVAQTAGSQLVASLVKVGTQYLINEVLFDSWNKKETVGTVTQAALETESIFATTMAKIVAGNMLVGAATANAAALGAVGAALAAAWAPAAAAVSLATQGANSIPATAGLVSTYATSKLMAIPAVAGFEEGGYTGDIGRSSIAGVVHGQEFVMNAAATARNRATLEAMNKGRESHKGEGWTVEVNNYGTPQTYEVESIDEGRIRLIARDEARGVVAKEAPGVVASDMRNPNSPTSKSMRDTHNVSRRR